MNHITALDIFNSIRTYYSNDTELLYVLFSGKFSYIGAKGRTVDVFVVNDDEIREARKDRIFDL